MALALSSNLPWERMNPLLASSLNPLLANPTNSISIISNVRLIAGTNIVNHLLGHMMNGWFLVDIQGIATIYRSAPMNNLTLTLTASAPVTVSLGVF